MSKSVFETLAGVDVTPYLKKKKTGNAELSYLSWAKAWELLLKYYPEANYSVTEWNDAPYFADPIIGYFVQTSVTIEGVTRSMRLPVLDGANKAMRDVSYEYQTKNGIKYVEACDSMAINTATQRCLVKNIALFGLGLSVYAGEDLVDNETTKSSFIVPKVWKGETWLSDKEYTELLRIKGASELYSSVLEYVKTRKCKTEYRDALQSRINELAAQIPKATDVPKLSPTISFIDNYILNSLVDINSCLKELLVTSFASENDLVSAKRGLNARAVELGFKYDKIRGCYE